MANGHVRYTKSWTGTTDMKKVVDRLDAELKAFVSSRKGTKYSEVQAQGGRGIRLAAALGVQG